MTTCATSRMGRRYFFRRVIQPGSSANLSEVDCMEAGVSIERWRCGAYRGEENANSVTQPFALFLQTEVALLVVEVGRQTSFGWRDKLTRGSKIAVPMVLRTSWNSTNCFEDATGLNLRNCLLTGPLYSSHYAQLLQLIFHLRAIFQTLNDE